MSPPRSTALNQLQLSYNCVTDPSTALNQLQLRDSPAALTHAYHRHPQVTLEPYERDHAMVVGTFRAPAKKKD